MRSTSPYRLTLFVCLAEIFGLASIAVFPALLPTFMTEWRLSHTEAGWISAAYYAGYMILVPVLAGITDRMDARKIMGLGAFLGALTAIVFALSAHGFWSALILRFLAGISLAGIYMPGLKVVSDHTEGTLQSRFISFYTASFSIGASLSYLLAGEINTMAGWRWSFAASAVGTAVALFIVRLYVPAAKICTSKRQALLADFKVVFSSRPAMSYVLGYAAHMWELFSLRSWLVAFLAFSIQLQPAGAFTWSPTQIAFLVNLIGLPASIGGNELSRKFGRRKVVTTVMIGSAALGSVLGFTAPLPYFTVAVLALLYGITVTGDSASLTAGVVAVAPAGFRGATLAVHSTIGFGAAFLGPLTVGVVLDFFQDSQLAWAMGFLTMAAGSLLGPLFLSRLKSE
ncbi:MAG: MFS transporter [Desulfobacteraceae bacterium]|jgi:MFS family permease|nr:MFS transporter [Desulfobacteraceae bacterium]